VVRGYLIYINQIGNLNGGGRAKLKWKLRLILYCKSEIRRNTEKGNQCIKRKAATLLHLNHSVHILPLLFCFHVSEPGGLIEMEGSERMKITIE
jgi:hypothetical protein